MSQIEMVPNLWSDNQSIFFFDPARSKEYLEQDRPQDITGERGLSEIIRLMDLKWHRMDRYWFQKNRHLDRKMRTKKEGGGGTGQQFAQLAHQSQFAGYNQQAPFRQHAMSSASGGEVR